MDPEIKAIRAAYRAISALDFDGRVRALDWLGSKIMSERHAILASDTDGSPQVWTEPKQEDAA